jgi:hypothetical protein
MYLYKLNYASTVLGVNAANNHKCLFKNETYVRCRREANSSTIDALIDGLLDYFLSKCDY